MKYDPRNLPEEALLHSDSNHPFHSELRKTITLLKLNNVYFIIEGVAVYSASYDDFQENEKYYYEEAACPINFIPVIKIACEGNTDPHGLFEHIESIWMTDETLDNLDKIFPQILKKE